MWPFSEIRKLRKEIESLNRQIRYLESKIKENEGVISSLQDEQKTTIEKLIVAESDRKLLKDNLLEVEYDVVTLNKDLDFFKNVEVTQDFLEVEESIKNRIQFVFVHGGAGTGKSTLIQWLKNRELIHVVLAPTGLAALNIEGMTIHKAFGFQPQQVFPKGGITSNLPADFLSVLKNLKEQNLATICIDEVSMVRADLLDAINLSLKNAFQTTEPFGGFQMVFVGDLFQLPPIVPSSAAQFFNPKLPSFPGNMQAWRSRWFFDSDVLSEYSNYKNTMRINLQKVFRQSGEKDFVEILNQLRRYEKRAKNAKILNDFFSRNKKASNSVILVGTNKQADDYNRKCLGMLQSASQHFVADKKGTFSDPKCSPPLPVPDDIELKIGEFIIIVRNDTLQKRYVNGTTALITRFGANGEVYVKNKDGEFDIQKSVWSDCQIMWNKELKRFENVEVGRYSQIPIIPGYAITCHKSQGKTLDNVFIDVQQTFAPGQMYVALSRTRSSKDITIARNLTDADFPCDSRLSELIQLGCL